MEEASQKSQMENQAKAQHILFANLEANVIYNIRVEVADVAGNNGTGTTTATTGIMPDAGAVGSLTWGGIVWNPTERTASTTISKGADVDESLQLQYQIVANSETQPVEGSYQTIDNGGTISGIKMEILYMHVYGMVTMEEKQHH